MFLRLDIALQVCVAVRRKIRNASSEFELEINAKQAIELTADLTGNEIAWKKRAL